MKVDHVFEEQIYLISSHSVARNPLFTKQVHCLRFQKKVEKYLSSICEIIEYCLQENQFQIIIRLRSRQEIIRHYRNKKGDQGIPERVIPLSSYIFSQAMANLLSSTAIWFNRKYNRTGALFARRFSKILIQSGQALEGWISRLHQMKAKHEYKGEWNLRKSERIQYKRLVQLAISPRSGGLNWLVSGKFFRKSTKNKHPILNSMIRISQIDLEAQFKIISSISIFKPWKQNPPPFPYK